MTNEEIITAILERKGYKQYNGNKDNLSPVMYFFLMDASKSFFEDMKKQKCSGEQKRLRKRMDEAYHVFFKDFFAAFTPEQTDYLIDKVDEYEEYLAHHFDIAEIAIQECDNGMPMDVQRERSKVWLCNFLVGDAQDFYGECWRDGMVRPLRHRDIDCILKAGHEYSRLRFGDGPQMSQKQFKRVQDAVRIIAKKTAWWIYEDYKKEIAKKNG